MITEFHRILLETLHCVKYLILILCRIPAVFAAVDVSRHHTRRWSVLEHRALLM